MIQDYSTKNYEIIIESIDCKEYKYYILNEKTLKNDILDSLNYY